jgi:hypothetical protein
LQFKSCHDFLEVLGSEGLNGAGADWYHDMVKSMEFGEGQIFTKGLVLTLAGHLAR